MPLWSPCLFACMRQISLKMSSIAESRSGAGMPGTSLWAELAPLTGTPALSWRWTRAFMPSSIFFNFTMSSLMRSAMGRSFNFRPFFFGPLPAFSTASGFQASLDTASSSARRMDSQSSQICRSSSFRFARAWSQSKAMRWSRRTLAMKLSTACVPRCVRPSCRNIFRSATADLRRQHRMWSWHRHRCGFTFAENLAIFCQNSRRTLWPLRSRALRMACWMTVADSFFFSSNRACRAFRARNSSAPRSDCSAQSWAATRAINASHLRPRSRRTPRSRRSSTRRACSSRDRTTLSVASLRSFSRRRRTSPWWLRRWRTRTSRSSGLQRCGIVFGSA